jgi:hypothetical protein
VNVITTIRFALLGRCQKGPRQKMIPSVNSTTDEPKIIPSQNVRAGFLKKSNTGGERG